MRIKSISTLAAVTATTAALAVVLSACGASSGGRVSPIAGGGSSSVASAVVIQAGQGARLSGIYDGDHFWNWEPSGIYPSDLVQVPDAEYNTGTATAPVTKYQLSSESCADMLHSAGGPGYGEVAYIYDEGENAAGTSVYAYAAYEFATADQATAYVKGMAAKFASCATFSENVNNQTVKVTMSLGDRSEAAGVPAADAAVDLRELVQVSGKTVVGDMLLAADGNVVVVEQRSAPGTKLPTEVALPTLAQDDLEAFTAGEGSGPAGAGGGAQASPSAPDAGVSALPSGYESAVGGGAR